MRDEFAPRLRDAGFKGSGLHFRRISGEIINAISLQGDKYGGRCAVNLGLHLSFLPMNWTHELPDPQKIKEVDCEFRTRLAPKRKHDYWWSYGGLLNPPSKSARHLIDTYFEFGEPLFEAFSTVEDIANMFLPSQLNGKSFLKGFGGVTVPRIALTLAKVHAHMGNTPSSAEYARIGLQNLGKAVALKSELEELASAT